jgi:predicted Zn finger-like uncharacterized protein
MTLSLTCPECSGKLKVADNLVGKKIKCPKCSTVFPAAAPEEAAITAKAPPPAAPERITSAIDSDEDLLDDEEEVKPRRSARNIRKKSDEGAVSTIIPYKNGRALAAYYCGVFSFIPCAGNLLGPAAFILGILGMRYVKAHPEAKGTGHAIAGIIMGALTTLFYWGLIVAVLAMGGIAAVSK